MVLKANYVNGETLSASAFNDVATEVNANTDQLADLAANTSAALSTGLTAIRANRNLNGGGTITVDASYNVLWSGRFLVISNGRGSTFSTAGFFDITCPTSGTITGVGGAANKTATAAGIPLAAYEALYYILPIGSGSASVAANFRVASYTTGDVEIPYNWVLICVRNGDNNSVTFNNGITLTASQSMNSIQQTNANTANTLVRRDGSGNFSANTVTASTLVSNVATGTAPLTVTSTTQVNNLNAQYVNGAFPSTAATASNIALRDTNANVSARGFISGFTSTVTSATAVTLTIASNPIQEFTGVTAQTVLLPSANVVAGQQYKIINNSTAVVTVQSSLGTGNTITSVIAGTEAIYTALVVTPTTAAHWEESYYAGPTTIMTLSNKTLASPTITGTAALPTTGVVDFYNTADQVTNFERGRISWGSNLFQIASENGGTGTRRELRLVNNGAILRVLPGSAVSGAVSVDAGTTGSPGVTQFGVNGTLGAASGVQSGVAITSTMSQTGTGGYTALLVNPTETSNTGTGPRRLIDAQVAGTSRFAVDSSGLVAGRSFIPGFTTTAPASAGTTTLTVSSSQIQEFTGTQTQTCVLPTTGVVAGQTFTIINNSTGAVTVQSSTLATIGAALTTGTSAEFIALVATPTTAANWHRR